MLNAALSVSYGSLGGYTGGVPNGYPGVYPAVGGGLRPIVGLQKLPVIQEDVPDDKKREKPDDPLRPGDPLGPGETLLPTVTVTSDPPSAESVRQEFIKNHNQRVEHFNNAFEQKTSGSRTGRIERPKFDQIT